MKTQSKLYLPQLHLPLLDQIPAALPAGKDEELVHALVELLIGVASNPSPAVPDAKRGHDESEADN
jgi:hypothetical protein